MDTTRSFRRLFKLDAARSSDELTDNPARIEKIRRVYDGAIKRVDLTIGRFAEPPPRNFGVQRNGIPRVPPHGIARTAERALKVGAAAAAAAGPAGV